jgi:hypothetical protein
MLDLSMVKRLVALSLALVFAAQLMAGICMCLNAAEDNHGKMSCCDSKKSDQASLSNATSCCKQTCGAPTGGIPGSTNSSAFQISAPIITAVENLIASLKPKPNFASDIPISKRAGDIPQLSIKPPELYLQNHAFLI